MICFPAMSLSDDILNGNLRAIARGMTLIESEENSARELLKALFYRTGRALVLGVTGSPGSGKSTLVDSLTQEYRSQGKTVGIVAVDPTSPFSGGSIMADRVRMSRHFNDAGVFIRSMATRGHLGGLARTTEKMISVLDSAGFDVILVETVGVGQDEVEIVRVADVCLVVLVPGMGDDLQAFKAGIMEIGDVFAINKADRPLVDKVEQELEAALSLAVREDSWTPTIVKTVATEGKGVSELVGEVLRFNQFRQASAQWRQRRQRIVEDSLRELLKEGLLEKAIQEKAIWDKLRAASAAVMDRQVDPYSAIEDIVKEL
ncbi:MAG: methylmalonyl Co-A mutase-associated GTPase MeaB [Terriglobia bacterium]